MRIAGLVLAGGRSRRFGSEKAMTLLDGRPMLAHVAATLSAGCETVAVNAPAPSAAAAWARASGLTALADRAGDPDGPLSGVRAGLAWAFEIGFDGLVTCPCDTPRLAGDAVSRLAAALASAPVAYAVSPEGPHPLCAAWRVDRLAPLDGVLAAGHPPVKALLDAWGARPIVFADASAFANVNTPAELKAVAQADKPARSTP